MFHTCFKCTIWFFCHLLLLLCLENLARRTLQGLAGEAGVAGTLVQSSAEGEERPEQPVKPPPEGRRTGATRTFWRPSTGIFRQGEGGWRRRRQQRSFTRQLGDRGCSSGSQIPWNAATSERGWWCYNSQGEFYTRLSGGEEDQIPSQLFFNSLSSTSHQLSLDLCHSLNMWLFRGLLMTTLIIIVFS